MPFEKSAGAVIFMKENNEIYYLLLRYKPGHWDFPKGHIESGETEEETVKREIEEETGIRDIKIIRGFKKTIKYVFHHRTILKTVVFYLAETREKEIKISPEHLDFKWLPYNEALKQLNFKNAKEILKKANDHIV